jgi:hypothetical protein
MAVLIVVGLVVLAVVLLSGLVLVLRRRRDRSREELFRRRPHGRGRVGRI